MILRRTELTSLRKVPLLFFLGTMGLGTTGPAVAAPFPAETPPVVVATMSDASGIVWHAGLQKLYVVIDSGLLVEMNADGSGQISWSGLGDIEGVTYADPAGEFVYIAREGPGSAILEFDLVQGQVTRIFDLQPWIAPTDVNQGLEAITFVPDVQSPEGGHFYTGVQEDGRIYVFELPIQSSTTATTVDFIESFTPNPARSDVSGLEFDRLNEVLFVLWDNDDRFAGYRTNRSLIEDWEMFVDDLPRQEGIAVDGSGQRLFSTEDDSGEIYQFAEFEVDASCSSTPDCDDLKFCTGVELCDDEECMPGTPPACPGQRCSEVLQQCVDCLTDDDCLAGEFCNATTGACMTDPPSTPLPVPVGDEWRYFKGTVEPPPLWTSLGFDESGWTPGSSGFGYGPDCPGQHGTELGDMADSYVSLYLRRFFHVEDADAVISLTLTLDYDDAFVAYLNDVEVARSNVSGAPPPHDQLANFNHECGTGEIFDLDLASLRTGTNVLAIQGHNLDYDSSDFSMIPLLESTVICSVPEVSSVTVERVPETQLGWADLGPGFVYDIVGSQLSTLLAQGDASGATCLADDLPGLTWEDTRPDPAAGEAYYYLVRGEQGCGVGSYGNASSGAERQPGADCP